MSRRTHRILLAALLISYGLVTVGGSVLHVLPGLENHGASLASEGKKAPAQPDQHNKAGHDCPICDFIAQGQLNVDPVETLLVEVVRLHPTTDLPLFFPPALDRPSSPRAPPLA